MKKIIDFTKKIKVFLESKTSGFFGNVYSRKRIRPKRDWVIILLFTAIAFVGSALAAFVLYLAISSGSFFLNQVEQIEKKQVLDTTTMNKIIKKTDLVKKNILNTANFENVDPSR